MAAPSGDEPLASVLHNRWVKLALFVLVGGVAAYALGALAYRLRGVLIPFSLALVGAYILNPLIERLQAKLRWRRLTVVVVVMSVFTLVVVTALGFGIYYAVVSIEKAAVSAQDALKEGGKPEGLIGQAKAALQRLPVEVRAEVENGIKNLPQHVRNHFALISTSVLKFVGAIVGSLLRFVLVSFDFVLFFVIAGYLLIDWPTIQAKTQALLPRWHRDDVLRIARAIDHDMRAFFRGQLLVALALGAIYTVGLLLCGVSFGLLIGVVAGLANIVPYLGIAVGLMPALLLSLIPYVGLLKPLGVLVSFSVAQMIEGFYLTPKIVGDNVGLSPVVVIL
ncbi:AI-2E family transporter, partial [bacterium]|nr:AI-2E family transporter [bacterium]